MVFKLRLILRNTRRFAEEDSKEKQAQQTGKNEYVCDRFHRSLTKILIVFQVA
jgi:hypothetical protein